MAHNFLLRFDAWLERYSGPGSVRAILVLGCLLILVFYGLTGYLLDITRFSPDSWSYYELAGTVFEGEFYSFNTWRSYFTETHSASFPLAYPVAVAVVQQIVGSSPLAAVWLNIAIAALTWVIGIRVAIRLGVSAFAALVLNTALVLSTPYLSEVFAGRSIPLAILWVLRAFSAYQRGSPLLGGGLLGLAAVTRFDLLPVSLLFIAGVALFDKGARRDLGWWITGLLIGVSPWIAYSWIHFGRLWASDNSWVALSALPAYVLDFPARSSITAFDAPGLWLERVFSNGPHLVWGVGGAVIRFPPLVALLVLAIWAVRDVERARISRVALALLLMAPSIAPHALTGYFDVRYFSLLMVASSLALVLLFIPSARPLMHALLAVALGVSIAMGGRYLVEASWKSYGLIQEGNFDPMAEDLSSLYKCHLMQPERTLVFVGGTVSALRYGATTGMKAASKPSNYFRMTEAERKKYFEYMEPFLVIDESFNYKNCTPHDKQ
jgi:hypothetical protein